MSYAVLSAYPLVVTFLVRITRRTVAQRTNSFPRLTSETTVYCKSPGQREEATRVATSPMPSLEKEILWYLDTHLKASSLHAMFMIWGVNICWCSVHDLYIKGLKATNEEQADGAGILHQVAQSPIDQVYLYTRHPRPSPPMQDPETLGTVCRAGRPIYPSKPPPLAQRRSWNMWAVNNYQRLSGALNVLGSEMFSEQP